MSAKKRTASQSERRDLYRGDRTNLHSSHIISAKEREYYGLANKNDSTTNYRMQTAKTNQSVHTTIDNHLLRQSPNHSMPGGSMTTASGQYIPEAVIASRVQQKIDVAKAQGDIHNERYRNTLYKSADAYGLDLRQFNGYQ